MRRRASFLLAVLVLAGLGQDAPRPPTKVLGRTERVLPEMASRLAPEPRRGLTLAGLRKQTTGPCAGAYHGARAGRCFHGPDPAPEGRDVLSDQPPQALSEQPPAQGATAAAGEDVPCEGDGVSGKRVQAVYARASDRADRYSQYAGAIAQWAAGVDRAFESSAQRTGGSRHVRWVTRPGCTLDVANVVLPPSADDDVDATIAAMEAAGWDRRDRMYVLWMDSNVYCGIASLWIDDSPGQTNRNNSGSSYARVDAACWGLSPSVEAHELMHALGAVQPSAPHSTGGHCSDEYDRMCYPDGSGIPMVYLCADRALEALFDCGNDDYFSTSPSGGSYLATHWNAASSAFLFAGTAPSPVPGQYVPLEPARILDTRGDGGPVAGGTVRDVQVAGRGGVPSSGVSAAVLNVTVTEPSGSSYVTVYPAGAPRPLASNLNVSSGQTVANLVVARLGDGGRVSVFLEAWTAHVVIDVAGWYSDTTGAASGRYRALDPARILDTREGGGPIAGATSRQVRVTGRGGVPASGVSAVVLNATATNPTRDSYLTLYPWGSAVPLASNLNFPAGRTVPNRVVVKLGDGGAIGVLNASGETDVVLDVGGWFTDDSGSTDPPGATAAMQPARLLDTRSDSGPVAGGVSRALTVVGRGGVPATGVTAAILNVTVTGPSLPGYVTVFPGGSGVPLASDLNFDAGLTVPNLVVVKLGPGGDVNLFVSAGAADLVVDVVGYVA